jgi:hypothetical protein
MRSTYASMQEPAWETFVASVPECAAHAKSGAFACLQHIPLSMSKLMTVMGMAVSTLPTEEHAFVPNFDGLGGVYPLPGSLILGRGQWA